MAEEIAGGGKGGTDAPILWTDDRAEGIKGTLLEVFIQCSSPAPVLQSSSSALVLTLYGRGNCGGGGRGGLMHPFYELMTVLRG